MAQRLNAVAAERGLSILGLALELGIPQPRLREWAAGISYPSKKYRRQVARLVGMSLAELDKEAHAHAAVRRAERAIAEVEAIGGDVSRLVPPEP